MANRTRAQLSTDSSTNFPDNTSQLISPLDLRNWITNGIDSFVTQKDKSELENAIYENRGDAIDAGGTTDLSLANGNFIHIRGTTLITSFGTCPEGSRFVLTFDQAANIQASSAIIIPGVSSGNTKTAVPNDCCMIISEGGGNWRIVGYFPAAGAGSGLVVDVTASAPLSSTGGTTPDISITQADGSTDGYLSSTHWNTFNDKVSSSGVPSAGEFAQFTTSNDITTATGSSTKLLIGTSDSSPIVTEISLGSNLTMSGSTLNATGGTGTITGVTAGTGLSGGGTSGTVTLNLANTAVTPNSYTNANITVDAQGRITSASNGSGGSTVPGGNPTELQFNNTGSFGGVPNATWDGTDLILKTPKIGQSVGNGHFSMHTINTSPPSPGETDYITIYADKSPKQIGARFETDAYTSAFQFGATADRVYSLPDATGNVLVDTVIPSLNNGTSAGEIRLKEATANGSEYVAIKSPASIATGASYALTLPTATGSSGMVMITDGSGNLSWATNGGALSTQYLKNFTSGQVTGTTAATIAQSLLIPANTFSSGQAFRIESRVSRTANAVASTTHALWINTSASLTGGPTALGSYSMGSGVAGGIMTRGLCILSSTSTTYSNVSAVTDITVNAQSFSNIDWSVNQYILVVITNPSTTTVSTGISVSIYPM